MPRKKLDRSAQDYPSYYKWNATTALCFHNNMICNNCASKDACRRGEQLPNEFNLKNVKFATLMTYRNIGKKGLERYLYDSL